MAEKRDGLSRRDLLQGAGAVVAAPALRIFQTPVGDDGKALIASIKDPVIRAGVEAAVNKNLVAAAVETQYPGYFTICADGGGYGNDTTWPGLDSWQMAGAYLLIGRTRLVTDYFDFVTASQRGDGNIPFAIFPGDTRPGTTYLRGMKYPEDQFRYAPPSRSGLPKSSQESKEWMRLFTHWEVKSNPLSTLGAICYILSAAEIFDATRSVPWLRSKIEPVQRAGLYLATKFGENRLISGSGFYQELPPREGFDGVTQCYAYHAFRELERLTKAAKVPVAANWKDLAIVLRAAFLGVFWRGDHFAEYLHITHGLVDSHGLSDTNWAAVAFGVADSNHLKLMWPVMMAEKGFWLDGVPTQTVTKPFTYQEWENDPVPFDIPSMTNDVAAMGRAWYLEALACKRMHEKDRLIDSARKVCEIAKDGYWRERYHPQRDGSVAPGGAEKYCEYAAVLVRVVLGNRDVFC